jgi:predicted CXXCH cytochrome family protein
MTRRRSQLRASRRDATAVPSGPTVGNDQAQRGDSWHAFAWKSSNWRRYAVTVVALILAAVLFDWWSVIPADVQATYVGRQTCIACHQRQFDQFENSDHDRAMEIATPATVLADFRDQTLDHLGVETRVFRRDDQFLVHTEGPDGKQRDYRVKYVFGVRPLQQYMVELDRPPDLADHEVARVQVLRWSWDTERKRWFHLDPPDVGERIMPGDDLHWTGITQCWNTSCADCHSTGLHKNFDLASNSYRTTFSEIDVSCEACHGPASLHVQMARSWSLFWDRKRGIGIARLSEASSREQIQVCAPCHSRRDPILPGFHAGQQFVDYYSPSLLADLQSVSLYHPDGQIRDEVYEYGSFLQSRMYEKAIRCVDCHDPHSARVKQPGNKLCTSCHAHPAGKYDGVNHHHHLPDSPGALCVECHMPATHFMEIDPRRDHSLRVPRPDLSVRYATPNACSGCHWKPEGFPLESPQETDRYAAAVERANSDPTVREQLKRLDQSMLAAVEQWYGPRQSRAHDRHAPRPHFSDRLTEALVEPERRDELLIGLSRDATVPGIVRATALFNLRDRTTTESLKAALDTLDSPDPLLSATAVTRLEFELERLLPRAENGSSSAAEDLRLRLVVEELEQLLQSPTRLTRTAAARALARIANRELRWLLSTRSRRMLDDLVDEWKRGLRMHSDRAGAHLVLGSLAQQAGELAEAEQEYRLAMRVEPNATGPRLNLAALLDSQAESLERSVAQAAEQGLTRRAEELAANWERIRIESRELRAMELQLLARDAALLPDNVGLQYRYGLALYLDGQEDAAERTLTHAVEIGPRLPDARMALALLLQKRKRIEEALQHVQVLVRQFPDERVYQDLEKELRRELRGNTDSHSP